MLVLRRELVVVPVEKSEITDLLVKYRENDQSQKDTLNYEREVNHFLQAFTENIICNQGKEIAFLRE